MTAVAPDTTATEILAKAVLTSDQGMDGKGCWRDNVLVDRLWRSVMYEDVYLKAYDSVGATTFAWASPSPRSNAGLCTRK